MFSNAKPQIEMILDLVKLCPEKLQEKCFDILLTSYVGSLNKDTAAQKQAKQQESEQQVEKDSKKDPVGTSQIPDAIRTRLVSMASRIKVTPEQIANLFDFNTDPFSYHAFAVQGTTKVEKTKNIALLLSAKSYLSGAGWTADWKEFRANCADQNCYDKANNPTTMKHNWFKTASPAEGIALSSAGITAAEAALAKFAGGSAE